MTTSSILGIVPGLMATSLVAQNIPKNFGVKKSKGMSIKRMTKLGVGNIVGVGLIGATSSSINSI